MAVCCPFGVPSQASVSSKMRIGGPPRGLEDPDEPVEPVDDVGGVGELLLVDRGVLEVAGELERQARYRRP